jgi:hypothetical protein
VFGEGDSTQTKEIKQIQLIDLFSGDVNVYANQGNNTADFSKNAD